jgi:hypothetical protein
MAKAVRIAKKQRGRPATTGRGTQIGERWHDAELAAIDAWIATSSDTSISRAHAVRRLVAIGLKAGKPAKSQRDSARSRAQDLADHAIEKIIDPAAPAEERAERRRRLVKGPSEFREDRRDLPKAKKK